MTDPIPYLEYWQNRQREQQQQNQQLARQACENLRPIIAYLLENLPITKIILFGSLVKGKFCETSDIDLAVEGIPKDNYFQVLARVNSLSGSEGLLQAERWIDLKPIEDLERHFLQRVLQTGECLYASDEC
jgi:predicted nucleotidyltransferase